MSALAAQALAIGEDVIAAYERDGAVCLRGLIEPRWLDIAARGIERNKSSPGHRFKYYGGDAARGGFFQDSCSWRRIGEYRDFAFHSPAAAIAATLMRATRVHLFFDNIMVKDPGTEATTPWHQDVPYWPIEGDQVASVWVPLDSISRENRLEFVAGSHRWGKKFVPKNFSNPTEYYDLTLPGFERMPDFDSRRGEFSILAWDMAPGDCLVFHGHVVHGAPGNRTSRPRRAIIMRYSGDDAVYAGDKHDQLGPPFPDCELASGAPIGGALFPEVWRRDG
ncbi:MAG: phytanoyl-CoA dioxygenase family protein [Alphaproteobacteria bacterium]